MARKGEGKENVTGRSLALTIIVGIFIAVMVVVLINLIVSYGYPEPKYEVFCNSSVIYAGNPKIITLEDKGCGSNSAALDAASRPCYMQNGIPIYNYDNNSCPVSFKECNMCNVDLTKAQNVYNGDVFFVFAILGFVLIVAGLFAKRLLLQITLLPAGAILVIESAIRNFNDKLAVIIVLALLVVAAIYLALKKLKD